MASFPPLLTQESLTITAKKQGHTKDECRKLKRKEELKRNNGQATKKEYPKSPTCDKPNHLAERCWKGTGAHIKGKNLKLDDTAPDETSNSQGDAKNKQITSIRTKTCKIDLA